MLASVHPHVCEDMCSGLALLPQFLDPERCDRSLGVEWVMFEDARPDDCSTNEVEELRRHIRELELSNRALRQTMEQRHGREGRLWKLLVNIPGMVYKGRPDWSNEVICQSRLVCGYAPGQFLKNEVNWLDIIHPDDRDRVLQESARLPDQPTSLTQRYRIIHESGDLRWIEDHKTFVFDKDGTFLGADGIAFDVTDSVVTQQALRESEARFRAIFESAADGFLLAEIDTGQFSMANSALCRMIGYGEEEIRQLNVRDIHPPRALAEVLETFAKHARGELHLSRNIPVQTKDGRVIYCDINAIPLAMNGKKYVLGVFRDVTEQRTLSEQLRESEELYKTLVESAGDSIARIDAAGRFLFMNKTAAFRLGGEPQDFIGKTMWDLFPLDIADRQAASVRDVIETRRGVNTMVPTVLRGETRWYSTAIEPLADAQGNITSALMVGRDIHELREAQRELEEYRSRMARAEQLASLGTLSATVAHELNQPLTVIQLTLQNCLAELQEGGSAQQAIADLQDCLEDVSAASSIVDRFKGFARQSRGRRLMWVDLGDTARQVVRIWAEAAERSRLSLIVEGFEQLPKLHIHERDIEQLFFALVENAIQAADPERGQKLLITAIAKDASIELRFADNCGGIAPTDLDKVLHPFFTTKTDKGGTGLGLGIVEHIVQRANGKITIDNRPGEGVTFIVRLPIPD